MTERRIVVCARNEEALEQLFVDGRQMNGIAVGGLRLFTIRAVLPEETTSPISSSLIVDKLSED